jgi:hypothetical protein
MAHFENASPTGKNFDSALTGQTGSFWVPEIFSNKVQVAFRKSSVCEAVCNTDYFGEIASYGDTVNIIKEPTITVSDYTRQATLSSSPLSDQELVLIIDQAKYFQFEVDDLEERFSHVNWQAVAADNAAYQLKDSYDTDVLSIMGAGAANVTGWGTAGAPIDMGHGTGDTDPLDILARLARELDDNNVPEENRYVIARPEFYEELAKTNSKLMSIDYNQGDGGLRNGLVASGQLRGFMMYKSNNTPVVAGTGSFSGTNYNQIIAGHMSAVAAASAMSQTESFRSPTTFADVVRGMLVWGRKVLRPEALVHSVYSTDID